LESQYVSGQNYLMQNEMLNAPWTEHMELEVPVMLEGTDAE